MVPIHVSATDLRAIVLAAIEGLSQPGRWNTTGYSAKLDGTPISIWHEDALKLSEDAHILKAAQKHFGFSQTEMNTLGRAMRVERALDLVDAQVRYLTQTKIHGKPVYITILEYTAC